jgi:probable HAF family extracellular repeat protein
MKIFRRGSFPVLAGAVAAAAALAVTGCSSSGGGSAAGAPPESLSLSGATASAAQAGSGQAAGYQVLTLDDDRDLTFNQLLGINNEGVIAGYFGSGAKGHPNKGYELRPPFAQGDFGNENFPGSVQTQVTGLNDWGMTVGFFSTQNTASQANNNFGFYEWRGRFYRVDFPTTYNSSPPVNQLLGVNDRGMAVGFYTNHAGSNRGYEYDIFTRQFSRVQVPGAPGGTAGPSLTAAAINNQGDIAGFYNKTSSTVDGFLRLSRGRFITIAYPGASSTQATGVSDSDEVVGTYTTGSGNSAVTHGFTWKNGRFATVDISGASSTTVNGVNDEGDIVGFYTDASGNTDGFVGLPR